MRFLVDTNVLLYAANRACTEHAQARQFLERHLREDTPWCLTWPVIYEFFRVSTHPRVFPEPLSPAEAFGFVSELLDHDAVHVLQPTGRHLALLRQTLDELSHPSGNLFHDIATAVILREHGVREIVTADNDFLQFRFLSVVNPITRLRSCP